MRELSFTELDTERTELLPTRETLSFGNSNWANIVANNSSMALNAAPSTPRAQRGVAGDQRHAGLITARGLPAEGEATPVPRSPPPIQHGRR